MKHITMTLSKISKFLLLFIFANALLSSCTKEEISADDYTQNNETNPNDSIPDSNDGDDDDYDNEEDDHNNDDDDLYELADCVEFVFPITVIFPDTLESTFVDEEELEDALYDWYDTNSDSTDLPTLRYPVQVIIEDGTTATINNDAELRAAVIECEVLDFLDDYLSNSCFTVTLPVSFVLPDNTSHSMNNVEEAINILIPYYTQNPSSDEPELVLPIEVTLSDGTVESVNTYNELEDLEDTCDD